MTPVLGRFSWREGDKLKAVRLASGRGEVRVDFSRATWRFLYHGVEVVVSAMALLVALPIMALIVVAIRADSPGPALFSQFRVGLNGRSFRFYKFRTMYSDSQARHPEFFDFSGVGPADLHLQHEFDPRVTRVGRWLRRTSLDELPNFWHVLTGDMVLVGPRPEMVEMLPHYDETTRAKFSVPPGITGYAQIYGRGKLSFEQTVAYDLQYVRDRSTTLDLKVIWQTFRCVVTQDGAF